MSLVERTLDSQSIRCADTYGVMVGVGPDGSLVPIATDANGNVLMTTNGTPGVLSDAIVLYRSPLYAPVAGINPQGGSQLFAVDAQGRVLVAPPPGTTFPVVGTTAGTVAAGNDARFASALTPEMYGAAANGTTDDSVAIQAAINAQASAGGGFVQLNPQRSYGVSVGGVTIPARVIVGMFQAPPPARHFVSFGAGDPGISPVPTASTPGQIVLLGGSGGTDASTPYIAVTGAGAGIRNVPFFDPDQAQNLTTPVAKPFAVRLLGDGGVAEGLEFVNVYRGLDVQNGQCYISKLTGNPLYIGLRADQCYDWTHIHDPHFADSWVRGTALAGWFAANSTSYSLLDNDGIEAANLVSYGYCTGLYLGASTVSGRSYHGSYGSVVGGNFDGGTYAVMDACTQGNGLELLGVGYTPYGAAPSSSYAYYAVSGKGGLTILNGGRVWGTAATNVRISGGVVRVVGVSFENTPALHLLNDAPASLDVIGNRFNAAATGSADISITAAGSNGRVTMNMAGDNSAGCRITSAASAVLVWLNGGPTADFGATSTTTAGVVRATNYLNAPTTGQGAEVAFNPAVGKGYFHSYDRTAGAYLPSVFDGPLEMPSLPTGDPHMVGRLWNNGGVVTVSAG